MKHINTNELFLGKIFFYLFSISWLIISVYGFFFFGWLKQLSDVTPIEFVIQFCALLLPVFIFFLLGVYWDKQKRFAQETQVIRGYLEELVYPTDKGKQYINSLTVDLKEQIKIFREVFESMSHQTEKLRDDLCQWIGDLNTIIEHVDEQTLGSIQNISKNMQTLADTTEAANSHVLESVRALATSADILNQVSVETAGQLTTTSDQLKLDTEEIRQTTHAVIQAQTQIEDALNGSGKLVSVLVDNTQKLENTIAQANDFKEFIKIIDTLNLRLKEMSMTLDLRLQNLKEKVDKMPADKMVNSIHTSSIDADFMKKVHLIIDQLHSASVEVAQILKPKDEESLWDKYYAGDKAVFVR